GLAHGDPRSATEPYLQVITSSLPGPGVDELLDPGVDELLAAEARRPGWRIGRRPYHPCAAVVSVDGVPVAFAGVESGDGWAVEARLSDHMLSVVGVRFAREGLTLVRIGEVEPYIPGRRNLLDSDY